MSGKAHARSDWGHGMRQRQATQAILRDRGIIYAITDCALNIIEVSQGEGDLPIWLNDWIGRPLIECAPELIGCEDALHEMLAGRLPRFQIPYINRELPDHTTAYLTMLTLPYYDDAGRIMGLVHVIQDVTEAGRLEQRLAQQRNDLRLLQEELRRRNLELEAANAELQRTDRIKSTFVSIAAHELRTPLASIIGYIEMLLDGDAGALTARQHEYLQIIEGSARRLLDITRDLLDLTRIEAGRLEITLRPTDLVELIDGVAAEFAPQLAAKNQHLRQTAAAGLPLALCDPSRVAQVVSNLLSNASKYSPAGAEIGLKIAPADAQSFLQVTVTDEGPGISEEEQRCIFEPFYRAPQAIQAGISGVGLGLYIARALVELHGGHLWFESATGRGSALHVTFPTVEVDRHPLGKRPTGDVSSGLCRRGGHPDHDDGDDQHQHGDHDYVG